MVICKVTKEFVINCCMISCVNIVNTIRLLESILRSIVSITWTEHTPTQPYCILIELIWRVQARTARKKILTRNLVSERSGKYYKMQIMITLVTGTLSLLMLSPWLPLKTPATSQPTFVTQLACDSDRPLLPSYSSLTLYISFYCGKIGWGHLFITIMDTIYLKVSKLSQQETSCPHTYTRWNILFAKHRFLFVRAQLKKNLLSNLINNWKLIFTIRSLVRRRVQSIRWKQICNFGGV